MTFAVEQKGESMSDLIYRQDAVKTMYDLCEDIDNESLHIDVIVDALENLPSASAELSNDSPKLDNKNGELISRQDAIKYFAELWECIEAISDREEWEDVCVTTVSEIKSAQSEQRYTKEELKAFRHGIILTSMTKQESQHWHYNKDTATEIEFLERLYEKVGIDIKGSEIR